MTAKGLFDMICAFTPDETITDKKAGNLYLYDQTLIAKDEVLAMMQQPVTTNIGKYKLLFSSFDAIISASDDQVVLTPTEGAALREIIGFKFDLDIGITADPDLVDGYGR